MGANTSSTSGVVQNDGKSGGTILMYHRRSQGLLQTPDHLVAGSSREKKKKMTGFATLRRKLIRRRRTSKSFDHGKVIREFVTDWNPLELNTLVEEYEVTAALKDLSVQADLARPPASTHKQDLSDLFDYKYASDVTLVFQGACFPAHRAILSARCAYFRDLLGSGSSFAVTRGQVTSSTQPVLVDSLQSRGIDVPTFVSLLRYLYTSDFSLHEGPGGPGVVSSHDVTANLEVLVRLGQEFGTPNALDQDLRYLMETGDLADAVLVFASGQEYGAASRGTTNTGSGGANGGGGSDYGFFPWLEIPCHKAILSARSPFFRSLIQRRCRAVVSTDGNGTTAATSSSMQPTRIVLDESVIPRRYARVLMQALYLDTVDLNCIVRSGAASGYPPPASASSSSSRAPTSSCTSSGALPTSSSSSTPLEQQESTATTTAASVPRPPTLFEEATELYQIGRFLELDILSQGCEDVLVEHLCLENLPWILRWSELPHGSPWVRRQALHLLREEFGTIAQASVLLELDKVHLIEVLQSDFLQASELEVLQAVLRWGEHQLVRRMEEREPNIVSQTAHSVSRKGVRRRDLNDVELRDILSELLPHVRVDHVLPPNHEALVAAIRRGLVSTPPSHMIGGDKGLAAAGSEHRLNAWIRGKNNGLYVKPRLFMPYFEETKTLLADQMVQEMELVRLRMVRMSSQIPDTLYMIDDKPSLPGARALLHMNENSASHYHQHAAFSSPSSSSSGSTTNDLDVVTGTVPVPDSETLQAMIRRERKLRLSPSSQRAYSLPLASRRDINRQIRLRVVREFNLPDAMADELESAAYQFAEEVEEEPQQQVVQQNPGNVWEPRKLSSSLAVRIPAPPKRMTSRMRAGVGEGDPFPSQHKQQLSRSNSLLALDLPVDVDDVGHHLLLHQHQSQLSEFIPDIALATAASTNSSVTSQLNLPAHFSASTTLQPPEPYRELQLDLGDGASGSSGRVSHEWSIIRPSMGLRDHHGTLGSSPASLNLHRPTIRMSTFRSSEENIVPENWGSASPRSQRRNRGLAAPPAPAGSGSTRTGPRSSSDIHVFI